MTRTPKGVADLEALERVFAALAHRSRRSILLVLYARGGSMTSGEIADRFDCTWPTITRHLGVLEEAGLLRVEVRGRQRCYTLETARLLDVAGGWIGRFEGAEAGTRGGRRGPRRAPPTPRPASTSCGQPTRSRASRRP